MATMLPPVYGVAFEFDVVLFAQSDNQIKTSPTIAAGDFVISKSNGATANLTTTPSESPASSGIVRVQLSATEMEADKLTVKYHDASGAEWHDGAVTIFTAAQTFDTMDTNIDGILADTNELQTDWANGGRLDVILDARASQTSVDDLPTNSELTTALADLPTNAELTAAIAAGDDAVLAAVADVPTNAELATALAAADDAVIAAIAALNNLSSAGAQAAAAAALTAYGAATAAALDDVPTNAELAAAVLPLALEATVGALNNIDVAAIIAALETETLPDSYSADGAQPTYAQALLEIRQFLMERGVINTTLTVNKPDGTTPAFSLELDDDVNPTSISRAS